MTALLVLRLLVLRLLVLRLLVLRLLVLRLLVLRLLLDPSIPRFLDSSKTIFASSGKFFATRSFKDNVLGLR